MKPFHWAALALASVASPALAGPPFLTDDPFPTDRGHWEIYAFASGDGHRSTIDADAGLDVNYGPIADVQLTATLPLSFSREPSGRWRSGSGDVELGIKYRFVNDETRGISVAIFPRAILPTSSLSSGGKARLLLPLWVGKDFAGGTSLFSGGGFEVNPGPGNRDFWQAGFAATHDFSEDLSLGTELTRQGADVVHGTGQTSAGIGGIIKLGGPGSLLVSGGPTWADHQTGYHFYTALGLNF
ncbi:MAG TPA: hypothetical protein VHE36_13535 [Sphingomicrobium sp.]|nr:hypothetical protein [Sphingomicrobium sp.]